MRTIEEHRVVDLEVVVSDEADFQKGLKALRQVGVAVRVSHTDAESEAADCWLWGQSAFRVVPLKLDGILLNGDIATRFEANLCKAIFVMVSIHPIDPV